MMPGITRLSRLYQLKASLASEKHFFWQMSCILCPQATQFSKPREANAKQGSANVVWHTWFSKHGPANVSIALGPCFMDDLECILEQAQPDTILGSKPLHNL